MVELDRGGDHLLGEHVVAAFDAVTVEDGSGGLSSVGRVLSSRQIIKLRQPRQDMSVVGVPAQQLHKITPGRSPASLAGFLASVGQWATRWATKTLECNRCRTVCFEKLASGGKIIRRRAGLPRALRSVSNGIVRSAGRWAMMRPRCGRDHS